MTGTRSPASRPRRVPVSRLASPETVTTSPGSARSRTRRPVIIFVRLAGGRGASGFRAHTSRPSTFTRYAAATFPNGSPGPAASAPEAVAMTPRQKARRSAVRTGYGTRSSVTEEIPDSLDRIFQKVL